MSDSTISEKDVRSFQTDYLKHLTTLSTGAILIIVAFLEKIFETPEWIALIAISLCGFFLCVLGALICIALHVADVEGTIDVDSSPWDRAAIGINWGSHIAFVAALLTFVIFAIKNIL